MIQRAEKHGVAGDIVHLAHMLGMNNYAIDLAKGTKIITKYDNGGVVREASSREEKSKNQKAVRKTERAMARELAKRGYKVFLLPETKTPGIKNPDAIVNNDIVEFKSISSVSPRRIVDKIYNASKQASVVFLAFKNNVDISVIFNQLGRGNIKSIDKLLVLNDRKFYIFPIK